LASFINDILTRLTVTGAAAAAAATETVTKAQTRLGQTSAASGRQFSAQAQGLGGLVGAYAGAAANIFAITAAFTALSAAARSEQTLQGINTLAAGVGESGPKILASLQAITKGQLTLTEASRNANLALSSGFNTDQIERLTSVSLKASRALGRDLNDSFSRLVRGSAKLEPELLDELGIFARIDPAVQAYAISTGKVVSALSRFEKQQAFVNAVITEGERKFAAINVTIPTSAERIERLGATVVNLITVFGQFLANVLAPFADFLSGNLTGTLAAVALLLRVVLAKSVTELAGKFAGLTTSIVGAGVSAANFATSISATTTANRAAAASSLALINVTNSGTRANQERLKAIREAAIAGTLSNAQIRESIPLLAAQAAAVRTATAALTANSSAAYASQLANTAARNAAANTAALAATSGVFAGLGRVAEGAAVLVSAATARIAATIAGVVSLAGRLVGIISIVTIFGTVLAGAFGKTKEFNAAISDLGKRFQALIGYDSKFAKFKDTLGVFAAQSLANIEKTNDGLRNLDEFKIGSKIVGIDIQIIKTKQELVTEVADAVSAATEQSKVSVTSGLAGLFTFQAIKGVAARLVTAAITATLAGVGSLAGPLGTAVGFGIAAGVGLAIERALRDDTTLDADTIDEIKGQFSSLFEGLVDTTQIETLAKTIVALKEDSTGLSLQSRLYLKTQTEIAAELVKQTMSYKALVSLQEVTGISAEKLQAVLGEVSSIAGNIVTTFSKGGGINFINAEEVSKQLDEVTTKIVSFRNDPKNKLIDDMARGALAPANGEPTEIDRAVELAAIAIADFTDLAETASDQLFTIFSILENINGSLVTSKVAFTDFRSIIAVGAQDLDQINTGLLAIQNSAEAAVAAQQAATIKQVLLQETILDAKTKRASLADQLRAIPNTGAGLGDLASLLAAQDEILAILLKQEQQTKNLLKSSAGRVRVATYIVKLAEDNAAKQIEILQTNLKIRDTFSSEIASASKLNGLFNDSFQIATSESAIRSNNLALVNEQFALGEALVALQKKNTATLEEAGVSQRNIQKILGLTSTLTAEQLNKQLEAIGLSQDQEIIARALKKLTGNQIVQLQASNSAQQALTGSIAKTVAEAKKLTDELEKSSRSLGQKSALAVLKETIDLAKLNSDIAKSEAQAAAASLSAETQLLSVQQKQYDLALKRADIEAKQQFDSSNNIRKSALGGLFTDKQQKSLEIKFEEESLKRLEDSLATQQKFITDIAANEVAKLNAQSGVADTERESRNQAIMDQRALQNDQDKFAQEEEKRQLNLIKLKGELIDEEGKMLSKIIGELAVASLGPGASDREKQDARTKSETSLKSILRPEEESFADRVVKQIEAVDTYYKEQIARNETLDDKAKEASEAAAKAAKAGIATQIQAIQLQADLDRQALQDTLDAKKAGIQLLKDLAEVEGNAILQGLAKGFSNAIDSIGSKLTEFFDAIAYGTLTLDNFKQGFNDLVFTIIDDIRKSFIQETIIAPITDGLKNVAGSFLSSAFGIELAPKEATILGDGSMLVTVTNAAQTGAADTNPIVEKLKEGEGFFSKVFTSVKTGFNNIFGQGGFVSNLVSGIFGQNGIFAGALSALGGMGKSIFSSLGDILGSILGGAGGSSGGSLGSIISAGIGLFTGTPIAAASGGLIRHMAQGGGVNSLRDRIPAMLEPGEFVLRKQAASAIGAPALASMNAGGGAGGNVVVNIKNEGTPQDATASQPKFDGEKFVIDIVTRDLSNNGPIRRSMRAGS
jgi:hypothetical protein